MGVGGVHELSEPGRERLRNEPFLEEGIGGDVHAIDRGSSPHGAFCPGEVSFTEADVTGSGSSSEVGNEEPRELPVIRDEIGGARRGNGGRILGLSQPIILLSHSGNVLFVRAGSRCESRGEDLSDLAEVLITPPDPEGLEDGECGAGGIALVGGDGVRVLGVNVDGGLRD
jgi:hypothetical protein